MGGLPSYGGVNMVCADGVCCSSRSSVARRRRSTTLRAQTAVFGVLLAWKLRTETRRFGPIRRLVGLSHPSCLFGRFASPLISPGPPRRAVRQDGAPVVLVLCLIALGFYNPPDLNYKSADKRLISAATEGLTYTCWVLYADQETAIGPDEVVFQLHDADADDDTGGSGKRESHRGSTTWMSGSAWASTQGRAMGSPRPSRKPLLAIGL